MSAPSGHPRLRAGIAQVLADVLLDSTHAQIGEICGCDRSTPGRRGADLHQWPASDLLQLAVHTPLLAEAIIRFLKGEAPPQGQSTDALPALLDDISEGAAITQQAVAAARDHKITADEAHQISAAIRHRRDLEDKRLIPALLAITQRTQP